MSNQPMNLNDLFHIKRLLLSFHLSLFLSLYFYLMSFNLRQFQWKSLLCSRWSHSAAASSATVQRTASLPNPPAKRYEAYSPYLNLGN